MNRLFFPLFLSVPILFSCGVKENNETPSSSNPIVQNQNLPGGVAVSKEKLFLIRPSRSDFKKDPQFKVVYTIVKGDLTPLEKEIDMKVKYWMPSMPLMKIKPAIIQEEEATKYSVTYGISMGGEWEFIISFEREGKEIDSLSYRVQVPR